MAARSAAPGPSQAQQQAQSQSQSQSQPQTQPQPQPRPAESAEGKEASNMYAFDHQPWPQSSDQSVSSASSSPTAKHLLSVNEQRILADASSQPSSSSSSTSSPPEQQQSRFKPAFRSNRYRYWEVQQSKDTDSIKDNILNQQASMNGFRLANIAKLPVRVGADEIGQPVYRRPSTSDDTLALLLPLLILLSTLLFLLLLFIILVIIVRRRARIALGDSDGPVDVGREEQLEGHGGLDGIEQRWLESVDEPTRQGYARAKDWTLSYPPSSQSTDITLTQFLSIQEKGVSAWSFDPDYESNPSVFVEARTEITFLADGQGMPPSEGGGCCVQSNLPLPKINEVYYWEAKMFNKPDNTNVALGLTTKPYPSFRMPGWSKYSIGFFSQDGFKCHNYPFAAQSYGPAYVQGDVIGVGYRPRTGTVFFTRNGKRLEDAFIGLNRHNLFPTVGADGACEVHVNLGQAGFVFIEANVKKWGLAPMVGTLAPPPAYGQERGSILIEAAGQGSSAGTATATATATGSGAGGMTPPPPISPGDERGPSSSQSHSRPAPGPAGAGAPIRSSSLPLRDSISDVSEGSPPNPPTPHRLDISLHSLNSSYFPPTPPPYNPEWNHGPGPGTGPGPGPGSQVRRGSGRTHAIANAVLGMLGDRGLLNPLPGTAGAGPGPGPEADYESATRSNTLQNGRTPPPATSWFSWITGSTSST